MRNERQAIPERNSTPELPDMERALSTTSEEQQYDVVHDLLQSSDPTVAEFVAKAWSMTQRQLGAEASFQPDFEHNVFGTMLHAVVDALRNTTTHIASRGAAFAMATCMLNVARPAEYAIGVSTAQAAETEVVETVCDPIRAYSAVLDMVEYLNRTNTSDNDITLPSYETARNGDTDVIFLDAIQTLRSEIAKRAQSDHSYQQALTIKTAHQAVAPPDFQPPFSLVERWLATDTLTPDAIRYTPGSTTMEEYEQAISNQDPEQLLAFVRDLYFHNQYEAAIERIWRSIEHNEVPPEVQKALALKIAAHQIPNGSNSIRYFYQRLQGTELAQDPEVQWVFSFTFTEVSAQHDAYLYEEDSPLLVPHLRNAKALDSNVTLFVHPFYTLAQPHDFYSEREGPPRNDFTNSIEAKTAIEDMAFTLFQQGIQSRDIAQVLRAIDMLEQYVAFSSPDVPTTYVVVLPKYETDTDELMATTQQRRATQNAWIANAFYESVPSSSMYYIESQTFGSGNLFPEDVALLSQNRSTMYTVAGESPKRCVSAAITDLSPHQLQPDTQGLAVDRREIDNFLRTDEEFRITMETMVNTLAEAYVQQPPKSFSELVHFYEHQYDSIKPYHKFTSRLFLPTVDRSGAKLIISPE